MRKLLLNSRFLTILFLITNLFFTSVTFGQATVTTDKLDYAPGEYVIITGSGWQPGETVSFHFDETPKPATCVNPHDLIAVADSNGNIYNNQFLIKDNHLGVHFVLTATGLSSGLIALTEFDDANITVAVTGLPAGTSLKVSYRLGTSNNTLPIGAYTETATFTPPSIPATFVQDNNKYIDFIFPDVIISGVTYTSTTIDAAGTILSGPSLQYLMPNSSAKTFIGIYVSTCTTPAAPNGATAQSFCSGTNPTVANLSATGTAIKWYDAATGGNLVASTTVLVNGTHYYASQTVSGCESASRLDVTASLNAINPGTIAKGATQPGSGCDTLNPGITGSVDATGSGSVSYTWEKSTDEGASWTVITSATSSQYNPDPFTVTTFFRRVATSTLNLVACSSISNVLTYVVNPSPTVASILPGGTTNVCVGATLSLSNATPGGVWSSSDNSLAIVSTSGLVTGIAAGSPTISYTYTDVNGCSKPANKTVNVLSLPTAVISGDGTICSGNSTNLSVALTGTPPWSITYTDGTAPVTVSGITSSPKVISVSPATDKTYTLTAASGANCTATSLTGSAVVTVNQPAVISLQSISQTVTYGASASFSVTATGTALTYQWQEKVGSGSFNNIIDGGVYSGSTTATLILSKPTVAMSTNKYRCVINGACSPTATSDGNAALNVNAKAITVTPTTGQTKVYGQSDPVFTYTNNPTLESGDSFSGELGRVAGANVGTYAYTLGTLSAGINYALNLGGVNTFSVTVKAAIVIANAKSKIYGSANPLLDAVVSGTENGDVLDYTVTTSADVTSGVGDYAISVALGSNPNYSITPTNALLSITKKEATIIANAKSKTYGAANPLLDAVVSGTENGDVLDYTLTTSADVTSGVGDYAISVSLGSNPNYSITPTNALLSITQKEATIIANAKSKIYGAANPLLDAVVSGTENGDVLNYTVTTSADVTSGVGDYAISVSLGSNPNYSITPTNALLSITQKEATIIANAKSKTYGAANPLLDAVVSGTENGDVLDYTVTTSADVTSGVGDYVISVALGSNPNYSITPTNALLSITKKEATIIANAKSKIYGAANPLLDAVVSGTENGDVLDYTLTTSADVTSGVGDYAISVALGSNPNYSITPTNALLSITKKEATIIANAKSKTYGAANPLLDAVVSGTENGDVLDYTLTTSADVTSGVGDYAISVSLGSNPNYSITPTNALLSITQKEATIIANAKSKIYGAANPLLDAVVSGTENGDVLNYTVTTSADVTSGVGDYAISVSLGSNPNYSITPTNALLSITQKEATIIANAKSKIYGAANPLLDAVVSGTENGDVLDYTLTTSADVTSGVGDYAISVALGSNPNYSITPTNALLSITKKEATIIANAKSKTYGAANPLLDAVVSGTENGDVLDYTLTTSADVTSGIGDYAISVALGSNPNYSITPTNALLSITKKEATIIANAKSKIYGAANPLLDAVVSGTENGDVLDYKVTTSADVTSGIGDYAISVALGSNPNYSITPTNALLSITKKEATIIANAKSKTYGAANPLLDAIVSGTENGDVLDYTVTTSADVTSGVGDYAISVALGSNPNYSITPTNALLSITKKEATIIANAKSKIYGAANPLLDAVVSGTENGDVLDYTVTTSADVTSGIGDYAISVALGSNPNYSITPTNALLSITKKEATIIANAKSKTYGAANPLLDAVVSGTENGDVLDYTVTTSADVTSGVGDYAISVALGSNPNYSITPTNALLSITKKEATIIANAKSKIYGDDNPVLDAAVSGAVNGDVLDYNLTTAALKYSDVGSYPIEVSLGLNPNYTVTPANSILIIGKRALTITADVKSKIYGDTDPSLTAQVTTGVIQNGDVASGSLSRVTGENVGTYAINKDSYTFGSNYEETYVGANLSIGLRPLVIHIFQQNKVYGNTDPALTYAITNGSLASNDAFTGSLIRVPGENVGLYLINRGTLTIKKGLIDVYANYNITYTGTDLTITPRPITITADAKFKCFKSPTPYSDPILTAQVTSGAIVSGDVATGSLLRVTGEASGGVYAISKGTYTYGNNYIETYVGANFTISGLTATFTRTNPNHYFGLSGDQTSKVTVTPSGGVGPYTISITMDRPLISNYMTNNGDESWIADQISAPGTITSSNVVLPNSGSLPISSYPSTTATVVNGSYSITVGLMDDAGFTATITDAKGCSITTEKIFIHGEDVRCFAGKSGNAKIKLCHRTGNSKNPCQELCVDESAVEAHLAHGDFLGTCTTNCVAPQTLVKMVSKDKKNIEIDSSVFDVKAYPNPTSHQFTLEVEGDSKEKIEVLVYDMMARMVKRFEKKDGNKILFGEELSSGEYLVLIRQGMNQKTINLIKK